MDSWDEQTIRLYSLSASTFWTLEVYQFLFLFFQNSLPITLLLRDELHSPVFGLPSPFTALILPPTLYIGQNDNHVGKPLGQKIVVEIDSLFPCLRIYW